MHGVILWYSPQLILDSARSQKSVVYLLPPPPWYNILLLNQQKEHKILTKKSSFVSLRITYLRRCIKKYKKKTPEVDLCILYDCSFYIPPGCFTKFENAVFFRHPVIKLTMILLRYVRPQKRNFGCIQKLKPVVFYELYH